MTYDHGEFPFTSTTRRLILIVVAAALVSLPGSGTLAQTLPGVAEGRISFVDKRTEVAGSDSRTNLFAPTITFGEETFNPSLFSRFQDALRLRAKPEEHLDVIVEQFVVLDYFPRRGDLHEGGLIGAYRARQQAQNTDQAMVDRLALPREGEAIVVRFVGTINGKAVSIELFEPYITPRLAILVRDSKPFKAALAKSIDDTAIEALRRVRKDALTTPPAPGAASPAPEKSLRPRPSAGPAGRRRRSGSASPGRRGAAGGRSR